MQDVSGMVAIAVVLTMNILLLFRIECLDSAEEGCRGSPSSCGSPQPEPAPLIFNFFYCASSLSDPNLLLEIYFSVSKYLHICIFTMSLHQSQLNIKCVNLKM